MKKILKLYIIAILGVITMIGLQSVLYAKGPEEYISEGSQDSEEYDSEDSEDQKEYVLDVKYYDWDDQDEPFEDYKQGENYIKVGEEVRLPSLGEQIKNKRVYRIDLGVDDDDIFEHINSKIGYCKRSFHMPYCDVDLEVAFEDIKGRKNDK